MRIRTQILILFLCAVGISCNWQQETQSAIDEPTSKVFKLNQDQQLILAAFNLETDRVKELLETGANPNAIFDVDDHELFEDNWLISNYMGFENWTPLLAVSSSLAESPNVESIENTSEAFDAAQRQRDATDPKVVEERDGRRVEIAKLLIDAGAGLDSDDGFGATALASSIDSGHEELALLLIELGADPNTKTGIYIDGPGDVTPLHVAAFHPRVLAALLDHGADVNVATSWGDTPLHYATLAGEIESVKLLIEAGVDVNAGDKNGERASRWSSSNPEIQKLLRQAEENSTE